MTYPLPFVAAVVADLNKENIPIVEYGALLNARFGYPVCINVRAMSMSKAFFIGISP